MADENEAVGSLQRAFKVKQSPKPEKSYGTKVIGPSDESSDNPNEESYWSRERVDGMVAKQAAKRKEEAATKEALNKRLKSRPSPTPETYGATEKE